MTAARIVLILFLLVATLQFAAILKEKLWLRRVTKGLLMPLLLAWYILSARQFLFTVAFGAVFGFFGDVLLLFPKDKRIFFTLGLGSFLLGHGCYIYSVLFFTGSFSLPVIIIALAVVAVVWVLSQRLIAPPRNMRVPVGVYSAVLGLLGVAAFCLLRYRGGLGARRTGIMVLGGSLLFMISDTILAWQTFRTMSRYGNLPVMTTYLAAQVCILGGLAAI
jgi:uncharacterized membrane protein YhhN